MDDERFATFSELAFMGFSGKIDSFLNSLRFHRLIIAFLILPEQKKQGIVV